MDYALRVFVRVSAFFLEKKSLVLKKNHLYAYVRAGVSLRGCYEYLKRLLLTPTNVFF